MLFTFDYELFLGSNSGSVKNCLINPTYKLLSVLEKYNHTSIFFVDLTYLIRLHEIKEKYEKAQNDWTMIEDQVNKISSLGHCVFHHVHPHWLDAVYVPESNKWNLSDKSRFSLDKLLDVEIDELFIKCNKILSNFNLKTPSIGYRAGGLYVQPFSRVKKQFMKYGIKYDFSVLKGAHSHSSNGKYAFDFTKCPDELIYSFRDRVTEKNTKGEFVEIALEQVELNGLRKILNGLHYRLNKNKANHKIYGDGVSSGNTINNRAKKSLSEYLNVRETISIELMNPFRNGLYFNSLKKSSFQHFISHPKLISDYNLQQFDSYLNKTTKKFTLVTDFIKIVE